MDKTTRNCVFHKIKNVVSNEIPRGHTPVVKLFVMKVRRQKDNGGYTGATLMQHVFAVARRTTKTAVLPLPTDTGITFFTLCKKNMF